MYIVYTFYKPLYPHPYTLPLHPYTSLLPLYSNTSQYGRESFFPDLFDRTVGSIDNDDGGCGDGGGGGGGGGGGNGKNIIGTIGNRLKYFLSKLFL